MSLIPFGFWAASGAGGGGAAYDLLETTTLTTNTASITFSGLGSYSDYKHLQIRMVGRSTATQYTYLTINGGLSAGSYAVHTLFGNGSSVASGAGTSQNSLALAYVSNLNSDPANQFGTAIVDILDFNSTTKNKTFRTFSGVTNTGSSANYVYVQSGVWLSTAAITSIATYDVGGFFTAGTRYSLYGIKAD